MANFNPDELARILVQRGGYNPTDARNAAYNKGGNAESLAREFGLVRPAFQQPSQTISPISGDRGAFMGRLKGEEEAFLGKFRGEFPSVISGLETQLGLPKLRETATSAVGALGDVSRLVEATPERTTQAARGFDVGANQLERMIAAETAKLAPTYRGATTAAQEALTAAQLGESQFGTRASLALKPYETEINLMKDRFAREATGFNADVESQFNLLLQKIQQEGARDLATISQATQLAQLEENKRQFEEGVNTVDLGNRVVVVDRSGKELGSFAKGQLSKLGEDGW